MADRAELLRHLKELERIKLDGLRFRLIDAKGMIVGRLAVEIVKILQGKDKPTYNPKHNMGDVVVVVNASHVHFTKDQWDSKVYRWHTGYPGGLRARGAAEQWDRDPTSILRNAVHGMLPSNRMRVYRMDKLKIFPEADHPYKMLDLVPFIPAPRSLVLPGMAWPLPAGLEPMNRDKFNFRARASPLLSSRRRGGEGQLGKGAAAAGLVGLDSLLTEEEKEAWRRQAGPGAGEGGAGDRKEAEQMRAQGQRQGQKGKAASGAKGGQKAGAS